MGRALPSSPNGGVMWTECHPRGDAAIPHQGYDLLYVRVKCNLNSQVLRDYHARDKTSKSCIVSRVVERITALFPAGEIRLRRVVSEIPYGAILCLECEDEVLSNIQAHPDIFASQLSTAVKNKDQLMSSAEFRALLHPAPHTQQLPEREGSMRYSVVFTCVIGSPICSHPRPVSRDTDIASLTKHMTKWLRHAEGGVGVSLRTPTGFVSLPPSETLEQYWQYGEMVGLQGEEGERGWREERWGEGATVQLRLIVEPAHLPLEEQTRTFLLTFDSAVPWLLLGVSGEGVGGGMSFCVCVCVEVEGWEWISAIDVHSLVFVHVMRMKGLRYVGSISISLAKGLEICVALHGQWRKKSANSALSDNWK